MTTDTQPRTATLTRIRLNLADRGVRRDLDRPGSLHKTLMLLAPEGLGDQPRRQAGLLYRLEHDTQQAPPTLLIQSRQPPSLHRLPRTYGTTQTRDLTPLLTALTTGRRVRYRITANPSVRRKVVDDPFFNPQPRHKDIPLHGGDALAWWQRKATRAGLALEYAELTPLLPSRHPTVRTPATNQQEKKPHVFRHALTRFEGLATITDPDQLRHALLTGIGRGKPYGAGLLSLAPA